MNARVPAIRVRHLWHRYGNRDVLRDVSFEVGHGEIFGFIGPNGAGKTTTIRIMATLLEPTRIAGTLGHAAEDMMGPWQAIASAGTSSTDWWPDDVPVVMGEIKVGEGAKTDAGLRVESDTLLFRVVGEGGAT